jgi:putative peptidoglycan lipid II flippase
VNVVVNGMFASEFDGGRSWLNCAFRLMQFPIGLFGVSLATVTLPAVARKFARDDMGSFGRTVRSSMRLTLFLSIPAAVGLAALAQPIISLIYQHGHFSARDTEQTALVLQAYAVGLAGYAAIKVLTPCFYALNLPRTPLRISLIAIGVNLVLNLANASLLGFGVAGLAVATSCVALANFGQLCAALSRQVDFGGLGEWAGFLLRVGLAAAACGGAAWGIYHLAETYLHVGVLRVGALMVAIGVAVGVYAGCAYALRITETTEFIAAISRRVLRRRAKAA